jgi:hypothetical protein
MAIAKRTTRVSRLKPIRRSVSLRPEIDRRIQTIAGREKRSSNQVMENLIEAGLAAKEAEKKHFFEVAGRLQASHDPREVEEAKNELARMTFGE